MKGMRQLCEAVMFDRFIRGRALRVYVIDLDCAVWPSARAYVSMDRTRDQAAALIRLNRKQVRESA